MILVCRVKKKKPNFMITHPLCCISLWLQRWLHIHQTSCLVPEGAPCTNWFCTGLYFIKRLTKLAKHISTLSNFIQLDTLSSYIANISRLPNSLEGTFSPSYLRSLDPVVASSANAYSCFDISIVVSYWEQVVKWMPLGKWLTIASWGKKWYHKTGGAEASWLAC